MNDPILVGITGGIGAGKTTVAQIFSALSVPVYYADIRSKIITNTDPSIRKEIQKSFGNESYSTAGLNRDHISSIVFRDQKKLELLNSIIHPRVTLDFQSWTRQQNSTYILKEAALLFESGSYSDLDNIIVVTSPLELRIRRISTRDPFRTLDEIRQIIARQSSDEQKEKKADFVIRNDENHLLIPQVLQIHQKLIS